MDRRRALAWLVTGLSASASPALARQTATITGRVTEGHSGRPLAGVRIGISRPALRTVTNAQGEYRLVVPLEASSHVVSLLAEAAGFASSSRRLTLIAGQTATSNFTLAPSELDLEELIVR